MKTNDSPNNPSINPLIHLWVLRMLIRLNAVKNFMSDGGLDDRHLMNVLGLSHWLDVSDEDFNHNDFKSELKKKHREMERRKGEFQLPCHLKKNIENIANILGLNEVECHILAFAVSAKANYLMSCLVDYMEHFLPSRAYYSLSIILDMPEKDIRSALSADSVLNQSGILEFEPWMCNFKRGLDDMLRLISDKFSEMMMLEETEPLDLLRGIVSIAPSPSLVLSDYSYVQDLINVIKSYLQKVVSSKKNSVNLLFYGPPGTGKTELSRVLSKELGYDLYEVSSEHLDGKQALSGRDRLRSFHVAQCFLKNRNVLLAFDEVEDVFDQFYRPYFNGECSKAIKSWMNRTLENNPVPTIWLSNSVQCMDPAFIRRFDFVFELKVPPQSQRVRILKKHCDGLLSDAHIKRIAEVPHLAPALVTRAASVLRSIQSELDEVQTKQSFDLMISNTLRAQGHRPLVASQVEHIPTFYDPNFVHADTCLGDLVQGLRSAKSARLCLYGPPGTGKTAYGRWLAKQLDMPLMLKRASDLMSPWVGQNEQNIAEMFAEASQEGALLLVDEVDTFLQDRRGASRSWEVSLVNEMLTQMEAFHGVFVASTNLMDGLDQAALRRFDLKVKFDYLQPEQAWRLFVKYADSLDLGEPEPDLRMVLARVPKLTPGDFAAASRRHRFHPLATPSALLRALQNACALKEGAKTPIGFV